MFERKKHIIMRFSDKYCYYSPTLSQLQFLFTNELRVSASGIVVSCSDQKFMNVSHEKSTLKSILRFLKNWIKIDPNLKKQNCDHTTSDV